MTIETIKTDLCILGGGSGGLSAAAGAAQMGADVVLLEGGKMGGDCLNYGCVPSKSLIAAAKQAYAMRAGAAFGVAPVEPEIDFAAAKDHVFRVIEKIKPHDSVERFEDLGVRVIEEFGAFTSPYEVTAGNYRIRARRFIIATGSSPFVPPIPGLEKTPFLTNETIFELRQRPDHLVIIGGGPIGIELAQAHRRLGCRVTVIEGLKALGRSHPAHTAIVLNQLKDEGIVIHEGMTAERVETLEGGAIRVHTNTEEPIEGSHLLVAVGRKPNIETLDLAAAHIKTHRAGIIVDRSLKTANRRVYAIGDVVGGAQFTHVAGYHASVVLKSALFGLPSKVRDDHIPSATYTDPEIAEVGISEKAAQDKFGSKAEIVTFEFGDNDRALAEGKPIGQVRAIIVRGKPVGASIVGASAGELIQTWALAIANGLKINAFASMIAPYPTIGEVSKRTAGVYFAKRLFESDKVKKIVRLVQRF